MGGKQRCKKKDQPNKKKTLSKIIFFFEKIFPIVFSKIFRLWFNPFHVDGQISISSYNNTSPMSSKEIWMAQAKIELNGKDPIDFLSKKYDGLDIEPYYDALDSFSNNEIVFAKETVPFQGPNGWLNLPRVDNNSDEKANEIALSHLQNGADGILFKPSKPISFEKLLKEIKPEFCFIGFEAERDSLDVYKALPSLYSSAQLNGAIFRPELFFPSNSSVSRSVLAMANLFRHYTKFRCHGIFVRDDDPVEEITNALQSALTIVDELTDNGFNAKSVFQQIGFSLDACNNFFIDVARIRSLKILMTRLAEGYSLSSIPTFVRVVCHADVEKPYQPHGSLLGNSFSALAAVMASADAISIVTDAANSEVHVRTARNISLLLREEAKLDKVIDPLAGSFFVESLTDSIVEKVWTTITQLR